jgi:SAM-dependent methyltransferase
MVAAARRIGTAAGPANVEYRVLDAERMDLPDDSVDAVVCRWGYMLMANPTAALGETRRVLRDGGPLALAVWAGAEHNPWAALPGRVLVERGHLPPPEPGAPSIFALADAERVQALLADVGFTEIAVEEIPFAFHHSSSDDLWGMQVEMSSRLASALNALPDDERAATRAAVEASLANFRQADGSYVLPALCLAALAR